MSDLDEEEYIATRKLNGLDKTADEMFKDLGYKKVEGLRDIHYCAEDNLIIFYKDFKGVEKRRIELVDFFTMQELQAINKKVEELGWI